MQQDDYQTSAAREKTHAKLFTVGHRQVLAFLHRDENDALVIVLQLWVAASDEQLQVVVHIHDDAMTQTAFDALSDAGVEQVLQELGVPTIIANIESEGA